MPTDYEVQTRRYDFRVWRYLEQTGYQSSNRRLLRLSDLVQTQGPTIDFTFSPGIAITFTDVPPDNLDLFRSDQKSVLAKAQLSDFDDMYSILQTEYPVYFHWTVSDDGTTITSYYLHADNEAVGEGPEDASP